MIVVLDRWQKSVSLTFILAALSFSFWLRLCGNIIRSIRDQSISHFLLLLLLLLFLLLLLLLLHLLLLLCLVLSLIVDIQLSVFLQKTALSPVTIEKVTCVILFLEIYELARFV